MGRSPIILWLVMAITTGFDVKAIGYAAIDATVDVPAAGRR
jgi:hypothetical protein